MGPEFCNATNDNDTRESNMSHVIHIGLDLVSLITQESGRVGRDGERVRAVIIIEDEDHKGYSFQ
jgi:superfamily II DNA helicase RecQ